MDRWRVANRGAKAIRQPPFVKAFLAEILNFPPRVWRHSENPRILVVWATAPGFANIRLRVG